MALQSSARRRLDEQFAPRPNEPFFPTWRQALRAMEARFAALETLEPQVSDAIENLRDAGIARINETLAPAIERIVELTELGFLTATSGSSVALVLGAQKEFVIDDIGGKRDLFTPSEFVDIVNTDNWRNRAVGHVVSYSPETGSLVVELDAVNLVDPEITTFSAWSISGAVGVHQFVHDEAEAAIDAAETAQAIRDEFGDPVAFQANVNATLAQAQAAAADAQAAADAAAAFDPSTFYTKVEADARYPLASDVPTIASLGDFSRNTAHLTHRFRNVYALADGMNIDTLSDSGFYRVYDPAGTVPADNAHWYLESFVSSVAGYAIQRLHARDDANLSYIRRRIANVWSSWQVEYHGGNFNPADYLADADLADVAAYRAGTAGRPIPADVAWAAAAHVQIPYAATIQPNFTTFLNAYIIATGNVALAQPLGAIRAGQMGMLEFTHSGAARTLSYSTTYYKAPSGFALSTTAGAVDYISFYGCRDGKVLLNVVKNPA